MSRVLAILVVAIAVGINASHAAMGSIPFEQLVRKANLILVGRVETVESEKRQLVARKDRKTEIDYVIHNVARIVADLIVKGEPISQPVFVEFLSGEDNPNYRSEETVVVFLKKIEDSNSYKTVGMLQGKYTVKEGKVVREGIPIGLFVNKIEYVLAR